MTAQHSSDTPEHGSPPEAVDLAHAAMGGIDLDPSSSPEWNAHVRAARVITAEQNAIRTPWFAGAPAPLKLRTDRTRPTFHEPRRVFLNPPGERTGRLVAAFWIALAEYFARGWVTSAVWVGFNVEQLARLQRVGARSHPLAHATLVPARRWSYRPSPGDKRLAEEPPHASFVTLLSRSSREMETFSSLGSKLGHVINGDRRP